MIDNYEARELEIREELASILIDSWIEINKRRRNADKRLDPLYGVTMQQLDVIIKALYSKIKQHEEKGEKT